jgi:chromosome segregation ATPase
MTAAPDDFAELRGRVDRLEVDMAEVRSRAENAETLAHLADRDTSDIKASHAAIMRSMQALREAQVAQGRDISELKVDVSELKVDVSELRRGLGVVRDGVTTIISLLSDGHAG